MVVTGCLWSERSWRDVQEDYRAAGFEESRRHRLGRSDRGNSRPFCSYRGSG